MDRDPYDWLLESYVWRFSATGRLGRATSREDVARAITRILHGITGCARRAEAAGGREEFREIVYRIVNNVRRIRERTQADPAGAREELERLEKDYDIVDPREHGLDDVVDWAASSVSSADLGDQLGNRATTLTLIVQRRLEQLVSGAQEGRFLAEAFIVPPNWVRWTCGERLMGERPPIEGRAGSQSGDLAVSFTQTRGFSKPREFEHVYRYDMTWSAGEYRFDFELLNRQDEKAAFVIDRGFIRGQKRLGHPGESVLSVDREAWLGGEYQQLNVYMPSVLRIQMFDALCVWLKDLRLAA